MPQTPIEDILRALGTAEPEEAWTQFLADYASQMYQVVRHFEPDADRASDCFQFVCEQLASDRSRRLRKFKGEGPATFSTWLRAVVRNLCIDWHRREFGRYRTFRSIARLSFFDREVFRLLYERGLSSEESLAELTLAFPDVTAERLAQSRDRIESELTTGQRWLLSTRASTASLDADAEGASNQPLDLIAELRDPRPDPEAQLVNVERQRSLKRALGKLSPQERLLILLRFDQELTLQQVAKLLGLGNAQRADRQLKEILVRLRKEIS